MKKSIIYCLTILTVACNQASTDNIDNGALKEKELELAKKELELKEKELELKETEIYRLQDNQDKEDSKTEEEIISDIREKFGAINYNIDSYKKVKKDLMDQSTEGGELEGHYKNGELKKIVASYYGEMGKLIEEYYFWDNDLFFVFTQDFSYNMPMYMDDSKVDKIDENRYYFHNDKLVRWLDTYKENVTNSKFNQKETEILQDTKNLKEKLK
jgi:hypothetical protein